MADLTPAQRRAVLAVLGSRTIAQAAQVAGVGERSLHRWLATPAFQAALAEERRALFGQAVDALRLASTEAVEALRMVLADDGTSPAVRVQAASALLANVFRGVELHDLDVRLRAVEQAQEERNTHG